MPPVVSPEGDITFHGREGVVVVLDFETDQGVPRDMSGATVRFEIDGFAKNLTPGPGISNMTLTLDRGELPNTIGRMVDFVVVDETGTVPHVIWSGRLNQIGWR